MTAIRQEDLIQSVADAFQYISYYHPLDYISRPWAKPTSARNLRQPKDAIAQILTNSRMAAEGHRPICQDTGIGMVFLKVGMKVTWDDATMSLQEMINEGVRRAYANPDNPCALRSSPTRRRPQEHQGQHPGRGAFRNRPRRPRGSHLCRQGGGGSEAKSKFAMLNPPTTWWTGCCTRFRNGRRLVPPASSASASAALRKRPCCWPRESIMAPVDIHELKAKAASGAKLTRAEELRLELYEKVNALGVGAQGSAVSPPSSTSRSWTTPATPPICRWPWCPTAPPPATATSTSTAPARLEVPRSWKTGPP